MVVQANDLARLEQEVELLPLVESLASGGIIKSCGLAKVSKVAYPWGNHTPIAAQSRRKDTPWTRVPQMTFKDKFPKLWVRWMNWPEREHNA